MTPNQILGSGGVATLSSATITGDLTVRTNKLAVTSTGVGANFATPTQALSVGGAIDFKSYVAHMDNFAVYAHSADGTIVSSFAGYPICFRVANSEKARIDSTGNVGIGVTPSAGKGCLQLSSGINFPATQVASSDANTLDDYEEGTWTPTVSGSSSAGVGVYSVQYGRYTKIGRNVFVQAYIDWSAHTGTGSMQFTNLPFTSENVSNGYSSVAIGEISGITLTASNYPTASIPPNTSRVNLGQSPTGGGVASAVTIDPSGYIFFSGSYQA